MSSKTKIKKRKQNAGASRFVIVPDEPCYAWKDLVSREPNLDAGEWTLQRFVSEILLSDSAIGQGAEAWEAVLEISDAVNAAYEDADGTPSYVALTSGQWNMLYQAAARKMRGSNNPVASSKLLNPAMMASLVRFSRAITDAATGLPDELKEPEADEADEADDENETEEN